MNASRQQDFDTAFSTIAEQRIGGLLVPHQDPFFTLERERLAELALRHTVPMMSAHRQFTEAGGLISYSSRPTDAWRQCGSYVGKILKGAKPADLPVQLATRFEFVINLKTANALRLTISPSLLARADEVIE